MRQAAKRLRPAPPTTRELTLERFVAAARKRGNRGVAIVEEFERAEDA